MKRGAIVALLAVAALVAALGAQREGRICGSLEQGKAACGAALSQGERPSAAYRKGLREDAKKAGHGWLFGEKR